MGYELNRLMKQYGVGTSSMSSYTGTAAPSIPTMPTGERPSGEDDTSVANQTAYDKKIADFNAYTADKTAFNESMRKYGLDQKSYDTYKTDYQNRLQNTPMYADSQFQTVPVSSIAQTNQSALSGNTLTPEIATSLMNRAMTTGLPKSESDKYGGYDKVKAMYTANGGDFTGNTSNQPGAIQQTTQRTMLQPIEQSTQPAASTVADLYNMYLGRDPETGVDGSALASTRPNFIEEAQRELSTKPNFGNQNLMNATGSYYGNQLKNPTYGGYSASMVNDTPQQQSDYYLQQRNLGYTDADLRGAKANTFGSPVESDWTALLNLSYPEYAKNLGNAYGSIGRTGFTGSAAIDNPGYNWWMNQLSMGAVKPEDLPKQVQQAALADGSWKPLPNLSTDQTVQLPAARGGSVYDLADKYAHGGKVKTHYQTAGAVDLPGDVDMRNRASEATNALIKSYFANPSEIAEAPPRESTDQVAVVEPVAPLTQIAGVKLKDAESGDAPPPVTIVPSAPTVVDSTSDSRTIGLRKLLDAYGPKTSAYDVDLKAARTAAKNESDAFAKMLTGAMSSPEDETSSKAEMYFRLAAAFGAPTKTGNFAENLSMVGKELGDYAKDKRASRQQKLALALKGQELKMGAAKEDLGVLRALSAEEMRDKRAIATELIKEYIKSGEPQSAAGKQAKDEGLVLGTPAYQTRVVEIGNANVEAKMASIASALSGVSTATSNLSVSQSKLDLDRQKFEEQKKQQSNLSPPELKLKVEAEDLIASSKQSLADLKKAYALNPNSLAGGWLDKGQQWLAEAANSKDPVIVNTRVINNLLSAQGLAKLRATFGGNPTEGERAILLELDGIGAKTKDERGKIILRAYQVLQDRMAREQARLDKINSGAYRSTSPIDGGNE